MMPAGQARSRRSEAGFTLVELAVVLVILSLAATFVLLAFPLARNDVRADAERIAARAVAARDLAIVSGRPVMLEVDATGFGVGRPGREAERTQWRAGVTAQAQPASTLFDPTGLSAPMTIRLSGEAAEAWVAIEADGQVHVRR